MRRILHLALLAMAMSSAFLVAAMAAQRVAVRIGEHPGFSRLVFDWGGPVGVRLEEKDGRATVYFDRPGDIDLSRYKSDPPRGIPDLTVTDAPSGATAVIALAEGARARLLEVDGVVVVDVLQAGTPLDAPPAELPPGKSPPAKPQLASPQLTKPPLAKPETKPIKAAKQPPAIPPEAEKPAAKVAAKATPEGVEQAPAGPVPPRKPAQPAAQTKHTPPAKAAAQTQQAIAAPAASPGVSPSASLATQPPVVPGAVVAVPIPPLADKTDPPTGHGPISLLPPTEAPTAGPAKGADGKSAVAPESKPASVEVVARAPVPKGRPLHRIPPAKPEVSSKSATATLPAATRVVTKKPGVVTKKPGVTSDGSITMIDTAPAPERSIDRDPSQLLRFDWSKEVAAAAYRRGASLWLVFDHPPPRDLTIDLARLAPQFGPYEQFTVAEATLIRMAAPPVLVPLLRKEGAAWIVDLWSADRAATPDIEITADGAVPPVTVSFAMPAASRVLSIEDPELGDRIIVVPVTDAGHGLSRSREYPQFRAIESYQGLVIQPFSEDIEVTLADGAARIRDAGGLVISYGGNLARSKADVSVPPTGPRLLDPDVWRRGGSHQYLTDKQDLQTALSSAAPEQISVARMDLGRFYFGHGLSAEALGVLRLRQDNDPRLGTDPQSRLMTGASEFLTDDFESAAKDLFDASLEGEWEAELWHAAYAAASHDWALAARRFARTEPLIAAYPHAIRTRLRLLAAEANLGIADTVAADRFLEQIRADAPNHAEQSQVAYLVGRRLQIEGKTDDAVAMWQRVLNSRHPPSQTRARVALLDLGLEQGTVSPEQAVQELERLRFAWRGDRFEFALLQRLGDLYIAQHDYRQGLRALRQAASYFPDTGRAQAVAQRMRDVFVDLYLGNVAAELPPLRALAMYEEFKELTPPGERGDEVIGTLVDRLVEVDLLDRAASLLTAQIKYRLTGAAKAKAGSRLAMIRLLDRSPTKAIDAIEISAEPNLPVALDRERRHLRVRALSQLGRYDSAMSELGKDDDAEALRLRADMLWAQKEWPAAAIALGRLVPAAPDADKPLSDEDSRAVMDLAVALTLSGEDEKLTALGKAYGEVMRTRPSALTFALLVGDPKAGQNKSIAEELAQVAEVEAFMTNYRERLQQQQAAVQ